MVTINNKSYYGIVYKITNKVNNKSYIGITTARRGFKSRYYHKGNGIERVYKYHLYKKQSGGYYNDYLLRSIEKYGFENFEVIEIFDTAQNEQELYNKEMIYIQQFDSFENGYNHTIGGEGGGGENQPKGKDNPLSVAVCQLTLDGKLVKIWDSLADIRRNSNYNVPNIVMTCRGVNAHSYGFLWVFKKDYDPKKNYKWQPSNNYKPIVWLDDNNNIIKEFISIKQVSDELHINRSTVRSTCNHRWEKPKYKLMFKNEYECLGEQRLNEGTL